MARLVCRSATEKFTSELRQDWWQKRKRRRMVKTLPPALPSLITMRPRRHIEINVTVEARDLMEFTDASLVQLEQAIRRLESALSTEDKS